MKTDSYMLGLVHGMLLVVGLLLVFGCDDTDRRHPQERGCTYRYYYTVSPGGHRFVYRCPDRDVTDGRGPLGAVPGPVNGAEVQP